MKEVLGLDFVVAGDFNLSRVVVVTLCCDFNGRNTKVYEEKISAVGFACYSFCCSSILVLVQSWYTHTVSAHVCVLLLLLCVCLCLCVCL